MCKDLCVNESSTILLVYLETVLKKVIRIGLFSHSKETLEKERKEKISQW